MQDAPARRSATARPPAAGRLALLALLAAGLAAPVRVHGDDEVRRLAGERRLLSGTIKSITPLEVVIETRGAGAQTVPVGDLELVAFDGEPAPLKTARARASVGDFAAVIAALDAIDVAQATRPEIAQDIAYYRALAAAKLALAGSGNLAEAGKQVRAFAEKHPNSHHTLAAKELLGDLLVAVNSPDRALGFYAELERVSDPRFQARARIGRGRALLAQQKMAEAQAAFEAALSDLGDGSDASLATLRAAATLGKATALARTGQVPAALKLVEGVIASSDAESAAQMAPAYVALGNCYRLQPDGAKPALLAFLHVDVLYPTHAQAHAEALANLASLWNELGRPERGLAASQTLTEKYPASPWARR